MFGAGSVSLAKRKSKPRKPQHCKSSTIACSPGFKLRAQGRMTCKGVRPGAFAAAQAR